jgi:hypothetical protein
MGRQIMKYTFGAVVVYLAVAYGTNFGNDITAAANGYGTAVGALQGRGANPAAATRRKKG